MYKIYWLTGLPCSGKTTIANEISRHIYAEILDGDDIREFMKNTDFSPEGREKHMLSVAELAHRFSQYNNVIVALVSPIKDVRDRIKKKYSNIIEVFIDCSINECINRDVKGMYEKALNGEIKDFTGVDAPYEKPIDSLTVDTFDLTVDECVNKILNHTHFEHPYSLFIGRWQPLHDGHKKLFDEIRKEGKQILIGIRNTGIDAINPYSVRERIEMIKKEIPDAEFIVLPDIGEVCYGRGVGYDIREIHLDKKVEAISATEIRGES